MSEPTDAGAVTRMLQRVNAGEAGAREELFQQVYAELRRIADAAIRRERPGHTLQPTALVNELYIKLAAIREIQWRDRRHFYGAAASAIRRLLIDHWRKHHRPKPPHVPLDENMPRIDEPMALDLLALNDALDELKDLNEREHEIFQLRTFAGLNMAEIAEVLGVSKRTVEGDWAMTKAWLKQKLADSK